MKKRDTDTNTQWPYPKNKLENHSMEIHKGVLYVFGGADGQRVLGCNIFMALDLETLEWEHLGGQSEPVAAFDFPSLRSYACSWVVPSLDKIFLAWGNVNRQAALINGEEHGSPHDVSCEDIWSWHTTHRIWTQERIQGNKPCRRTEAAAVFNPVMNRTVLFGGYDGAMPTSGAKEMEKGMAFTYSYYADTFLWDPKTNLWAYVLTRGFPTYRAGMNLIVDSDTGGTYLFGGYTNSEFVPSTHLHARHFHDLWQLRVDLPAGGEKGMFRLEKEDLEMEARTATMGPWRTCYACGSVGRWRKCGGSCGSTYFCTIECQKEAWPEHKKLPCKAR